jgi:hypothetical protein
MSQWYLSYGANQMGPMDKSRAMAQASPERGGGKGEGSIRGPLGSLLGGD